MGQAVKVKNLRSSRAFPDLVIYEQKRGFAALFLELKKDGVKIYRKDGSLLADEHIKEQAAMISLLNARGYKASFATGFDQAREIIDWYFNE